jgi:hypothetical protein
MSNNKSIMKEKRKQLTELFIAGARTQDAAKKVDISIGRATYFRTKLVSAGVIDRKRTRRNKVTAAPVVKTTPTVEAVTLAKIASQTPDLTPVLGEAFVFRINNMEVQISDARKVHVKKGMIEIKY